MIKGMDAVDNLINPAKQWLESLQQRERNIVIAGAIALVIMLFYLAIWDPVIAKFEHQKQQLDSQRQLYSWMKSATAEIQSLKATGNSSIAKTRNQSISSLANRSAITSGVKPFINKIEQTKNGVKVQLKAASFDSFVTWLTDLQNKYGIIASKVKIEKTKVKGSVDINITLERSS